MLDLLQGRVDLVLIFLEVKMLLGEVGVVR